MITDCPREHGDAACRRVGDSGVDLVDREGLLAQLGEPDDVHAATLHRAAAHHASQDSRRRLRT